MFLVLLAACSWLTLPDSGPEPTRITIVRGDTLGKLAKTHGVTVRDLKQWNDLDSDLIEVGQVLIIPADGTAAVTPPSGRRTRPTTRPTTAPSPDGDADTAPDQEGPILPRIPRPPAKACVPPPDGSTLGEAGTVASAGLDKQQIQRSMTEFLPRAEGCLVGLPSAPAGSLDLAIGVGCDGRVTGVSILDAHDWPDAHADCYRQALSSAAFPAHALPDGDDFVYPLRMR